MMMQDSATNTYRSKLLGLLFNNLCHPLTAAGQQIFFTWLMLGNILQVQL